MLAADAQGNMLADDGADKVAQRLEAVDVFRVHEHAIGQCARLVAGDLVGLVEIGPHLRVLVEEDVVEVGGQRLATGLQQGHGGTDNGAVFGGDHALALSSLGTPLVSTSRARRCSAMESTC
jgi:hypothetical protein